jgi:GNAT superfamily N-acetyltransferase
MAEAEKKSTLATTGSTEGLRIHVLSAIERHRRWKFNLDDPDRAELWPGLRFLISEYAFGPRSMVIGATVDKGRRLVARTKISCSQVSKALWHSGYTRTDPEFRGKGIAKLLMQAELEQVAKAGGIYCDGYVAEDNTASIKMCLSVGFRPISFIRVHVAKETRRGEDQLRLAPIRCIDLRDFPPGCRLMEAIAGAKWLVVLAEEFVRRRPLLPWKSPAAELYEIICDRKTVGIARCAGGQANVMLETDALFERGLGMAGTLLDALSGAGKVPGMFLFLQKSTWDQIEKAGSTARFDYIYLWERGALP